MAETEPKELCGVCVLLFGVDLVNHKKDGLSGATQQPRKFLIRSRDGGAAVDDKEDECRSINGDFGLFEDFLRDLGFITRDHAAGVHDLKGPAAPTRSAVDAIAGDPGFICND